MNPELYNKWVTSHQAKDIDIADAVMSQITQKAHRPNVFEETCEHILLDLTQTKILVRACVLTSGAVLGLLRMGFQMYSVLFT